MRGAGIDEPLEALGGQPVVSETKPYRVVAKIKNNRLWTTILRVFPKVVTQSDAARALRVRPTEIGRYLNMRIFPMRRDGVYMKGALRIAKRLRETPEYLFDPVLYGRAPQTIEIEIEIGEKQLPGLVMAALPAPDEEFEKLECTDAIDHALAVLTSRERRVLELRFGFVDGHEHTLEEIAGGFGRTTERVRQIEGRALRKLRHPKYAKPLREHASPSGYWKLSKKPRTRFHVRQPVHSLTTELPKLDPATGPGVDS